MQRDQMDPWRQQILADIGISTWIRRDQLPSLAVVVETSSRQPQPVQDNPASSASQSGTAGSALAALAQSLDAGSAAKSPSHSLRQAQTAAAPVPLATPQSVRYPEVTCLWCGDAVLFCPPDELQGQVRLVKDILASAANGWTQATEQVIFRWAELQASGFAAADAERALLAFAEKRIEVAAARWVLCTPALQPLLTQLVFPVRTRFLGLAPLADIARQASLKQSLWQTLQSPAVVPATAQDQAPSVDG